MKSILCFGDSNTWGYDPVTKDRFSREQRWVGVLARELGPEFEAIPEGLNGRTTVWDDPIELYKNGSQQLPPILETHRPLDLVVIMLGTNDLKKRFSVCPSDIAKGAGVLVGLVQGLRRPGTDFRPPKVLLIAPPPVAKLTDFAEMFEGSQEKSRQFSRCFKEVADLYACDFLDAGSIIASSDVDGIHFEVSEHQKLGKAVAAKVRDILG
jgi:lysophospholipase L1-like esterase